MANSRHAEPRRARMESRPTPARRAPVPSKPTETDTRRCSIISPHSRRNFFETNGGRRGIHLRSRHSRLFLLGQQLAPERPRLSTASNQAQIRWCNWVLPPRAALIRRLSTHRSFDTRCQFENAVGHNLDLFVREVSNRGRKCAFVWGIFSGGYELHDIVVERLHFMRQDIRRHENQAFMASCYQAFPNPAWVRG